MGLFRSGFRNTAANIISHHQFLPFNFVRKMAAVCRRAATALPKGKVGKAPMHLVPFLFQVRLPKKIGRPREEAAKFVGD